MKHCTIRIILGLVNQYDLELGQLDVKTAFLHGNLKETIYMNQPEGVKEAIWLKGMVNERGIA